MNNDPKLILAIDSDEYLLGANLTDSDKLLLLKILSAIRKVDSRSNYIPDADSEYATAANVLTERPVDVTLKITCAPLMTREEFRTAREAGKRIYDNARKAPPASAVPGVPPEAATSF